LVLSNAAGLSREDTDGLLNRESDVSPIVLGEDMGLAFICKSRT
jgi:hypothetical protein